MKRIGLDIGSTTIKCVVLGEDNTLLFSTYRRHLSQISQKDSRAIARDRGQGREGTYLVSISGSAGMGMAQDLGIPFVQEVYATKIAVSQYAPETDVVIELGGRTPRSCF